MDDFRTDEMMKRAVCYALQVIGEAANNLSDTAQAKAPTIPWPRIIGFRNRVVHGYFAIDFEEVWRIATADVPELGRQLREAGLWA